jgi:hypothetical protein
MLPNMARHIVLAILWFHVGWVAGSATAFVLGLPGIVAPVVAIVTLAVIWRITLVAGDARPATSVPQHRLGMASEG